MKMKNEFTKMRTGLPERTINQMETINNIKRIRTEKKISQAKAAAAIGLTRAYYNRIENFTIQIKKDHINNLASLFNVSVDDIVVYKKDYNEGFCDCLEQYGHSFFDNIEYYLFGLDKYLEHSKYIESSMYLLLQEMGYKIELRGVDGAEVEFEFFRVAPGDPDYIEDVEVNSVDDSSLEDDLAILLKKKDRKMCYWPLKDYFAFEKYIKTSIQGYIDNLVKDFKNNVKIREDLVDPYEQMAKDDLSQIEQNSTKRVMARIKKVKRIISSIERSLEKETKSE